MLKSIKSLATVTMAIIFSVALATPSLAQSIYNGPWSYNGSNLVLGNQLGNGMYMRNSPRYCGRPGISFARMRAILDNNNRQNITWWIDYECNDNHARVCIRNLRGQQGCSTLRVLRIAPYYHIN